MSRLEQRLSLACPLAQAASRLRDFFRAHQGEDADTVTLKLGVTVRIPGRDEPLTLQRGVIATIRPHRVAADMTPRYAVHWASAEPGPFPVFDGELVVEGNDDYDTFALRLSGAYTPPLGLVGKGFDAVVGHRVAEATASDFLGRIRDAVERDFQRNEAAKGPADA